MAPFCSCPASLVSRKFFAVGPGCAKFFFFLLRSVGRRDLSAGPGQKKKHHPGCFFLLRPWGKGRRRRSPVPARGQSKKKKHPWWCFFCFALAPCRRPTGLLLLLPFAGAAAKKKHPGWCFFCLLWPRAGTGLLLPLPFPGAGAKKNTPWVVFFFFAADPAGRSLTHCGPGWRCLPLAGVVFFVAAPPGPGWCFFFAVAPPGRSLTHCGLGRFRQGPGGVFFLAAAPPGLF